MTAETDRKMLLELLTDHAGELTDGQREAFRDMFSDDRPLSFKQREWVSSVHESFSPKYENLVSSGKVPRGREVESLVRDKPLRPPARCAS